MCGLPVQFDPKHHSYCTRVYVVTAATSSVYFSDFPAALLDTVRYLPGLSYSHYLLSVFTNIFHLYTVLNALCYIKYLAMCGMQVIKCCRNQISLLRFSVWQNLLSDLYIWLSTQINQSSHLISSFVCRLSVFCVRGQRICLVTCLISGYLSTQWTKSPQFRCGSALMNHQSYPISGQCSLQYNRKDFPYG